SIWRRGVTHRPGSPGRRRDACTSAGLWRICVRARPVVLTEGWGRAINILVEPFRRLADQRVLRLAATRVRASPEGTTISGRGVLLSRHDKYERMQRVQGFMEAKGYRCVSTSMRLFVTEMTFERGDP